MHRSTWSRWVGMMVLGALTAALPAAAVAGHSSHAPAAPDARSADLGTALAADGTFRGTPGLAGTVDASAWTLVSDLAAGEPPRFAPVADRRVKRAAAPIGSWSHLGSNGHGNGALDFDVLALAVSGTDLYVGGRFKNAAGLAKADYIARWNGSTWSALGANGAGGGALDEEVLALAVSGNDLYVGGVFVTVAGLAGADYIARWDGSAWSAAGSDRGEGALNGDVSALAVSGGDLYVGGGFSDAGGIPTADHIAKWSPSGSRQPDGRIRLGAGASIGNDVYDTSGTGQSRTGSAAQGATITFGISVQNDGSAVDSLTVKATGIAAGGYSVRYFRGTTDITAAVVAGMYEISSLAPTMVSVITARVTVKPTAAVGSKVTRLVTITSLGDGTKKDAVGFTVKRN
jgi:hypothetical protein